VANADSTVRVNIIGDAKKLQNATDKAEKAIGGFSTSGAIKQAGLALGGLFAVDKVFDFANSALNEVDRLGDATDRLRATVPGLADDLVATAGGMERLGQSKQDVLELEARFVDLATAAHLSDEAIGATTPTSVEAAAALAQLGIGGGDTATVLDLIGKAAGGSSKPLKELGIDLTDTEVEARAMADTGKDNADALTEGELAAARLSLILEQLDPRVKAVTEGTRDLESVQGELNAKFETFTGNVGDALDGPLIELLGWLMATGEEADRGAKSINAVSGAFDDLEGQVGDVVDILRQALDLLRTVGSFLPNSGGLNFAVNGVGNGKPVTVNVQGGSPEVVEQAVRDALVRLNGAAHAHDLG